MDDGTYDVVTICPSCLPGYPCLVCYNEYIPVSGTADGIIDYYTAVVLTANDYYPFGMGMPGRKYSASGAYRYGFNGQERSTEIEPNGNSMTAEFWQYDARLGRRWNVDPQPDMSISVYVSFRGNPIYFTDLSGDTTLPQANGELMYVSPSTEVETFEGGPKKLANTSTVVEPMEGSIRSIKPQFGPRFVATFGTASGKYLGLFSEENLDFSYEDWIKEEEEINQQAALDFLWSLVKRSNPIESIDINLSLLHKETLRDGGSLKMVMPYGVQYSYTSADNTFARVPITPLNNTYYNINLGGYLDMRYSPIQHSPVNSVGDIFNNGRVLINVGRDWRLPFATTAKAQLDINAQGTNMNQLLNNLEVGRRFVAERDMPALFSPSRSSFEINFGFRVKMKSPGKILTNVLTGGPDN